MGVRSTGDDDDDVCVCGRLFSGKLGAEDTSNVMMMLFGVCSAGLVVGLLAPEETAPSRKTDDQDRTAYEEEEESDVTAGTLVEALGRDILGVGLVVAFSLTPG